MGHPDYETALAVYQRIAERSEVVQIHPQWDAVLWIRAENGHLYKREDRGEGVRSECQIPFRSLAMYLGCAEGHRIVSGEQLPAIAAEETG